MEYSLHTFLQLAQTFLLEHGLKIIAICIGAYIIQNISGYFIARAVRSLVRPGNLSRIAEEKRENTLIQVVSGTMMVMIWVVSVLMILSELGVAIGPLLAAAGIAGVAVGFGGQYLIRDIITGMFIILENQYRVGDVVCFGDTCGSVEHISLRMTMLRDLDGTVHHIPHGEVKTVSNMTKGYARVNLDVGVGYGSDIGQVIEVINAVGQELANDPYWKDQIMEAPAFLRIDTFGDSALIVKILGKVQPLAQWDVTGELRKRLKSAFDQAGIEIPFPQRVLHTRTD
jgi:small conductance mechanosensitive channel